MAKDLNIWQLLAAYGMILVLLWIVKVRGIRREKQIFIATVRMTVQLVLAGYILGYIFKLNHPGLTVAILGIMLAFAVYTIFKQIQIPMSRALKKVIGLSLTVGILLNLTYFVLFILHLSPWYEPRYLIPIAGMVIGNSMTGVALGIHALLEEIRTNQDQIEAALMLGASPKMTMKEMVNHSFDSAMMPTINSMVTMGIVFLPGMMTGQIISGTSPLLAVEYQIAIMLGIVGGVSLSVILSIQFGCRTFFNQRKQFMKDI